MYYVAIRNNKTREIRLRQENLEWDEYSHFWWTEGNMSCDCNRELEFERAIRNEPYHDTKCGEKRYSVLYAVVDGTKIPVDEVIPIKETENENRKSE